MLGVARISHEPESVVMLGVTCHTFWPLAALVGP